MTDAAINTIKTIWITGANGFIGRHLASEISQQGSRVHGLGHGIWGGLDQERHGLLSWLNGDITIGNLSNLLGQTAAPDVIYHLAGGSSVGASLANPREDFRRTVESSAELLDWIRQYCPTPHLVVISSAAVYGNQASTRIPEDAPLHPYSPYGTHKRLMEELCRSYVENFGLTITVTRLFSVYGAGLRKQLLWDLCTRMHRRENPLKLGGSGNELRDWIEVRDLVKALWQLQAHPGDGLHTVNVGTGIGTPVHVVAEHLVRSWQASYGFFPEIQFSGQSRAGDPFSLVAETSRLFQSGVTIETSLERGIDDYVQWYGQFEQVGS